MFIGAGLDKKKKQNLTSTSKLPTRRSGFIQSRLDDEKEDENDNKSKLDELFYDGLTSKNRDFESRNLNLMNTLLPEFDYNKVKQEEKLNKTFNVEPKTTSNSKEIPEWISFATGLADKASLGLMSAQANRNMNPAGLPELNPNNPNPNELMKRHLEEAKRQNPKSYGSGEFVGGAIPMLLLGGGGAGVEAGLAGTSKLPWIAETALEGAKIGGGQALAESTIRNLGSGDFKNKNLADTAVDMATDTAEGVLMGAGGNVAFGGLGRLLGKGFNSLKSALKTPAKELATNTEKITLEPIVNTVSKEIKPTTGTGKYTVKNTEYDNVLNEYNDAISQIQNHFGTNELRANEIPKIKDELGIDLDDIINRMEKAETKNLNLPNSETMRLKRVAGATSDKADNVINRVRDELAQFDEVEDSNPLALFKNYADKNFKKPVKNINNVDNTIEDTFTNNITNDVRNNVKNNVKNDLNIESNIEGINKNTNTNTIVNKSAKTVNTVNEELIPNQMITKPPREQGKSKFAQTVKNADVTDKAYAETIIPPEYQKVENQATWTKALNNVKKNADEVYSRIVNKTDKDTFTHQDTADSMALIDKLSREGNYTQANELLEKATMKLTEAGQTIQAASMWARQTPTGMLKYAEGVMQKARSSMAKKDPELKALIDEIASLKSKINDMKSTKTALQKEAIKAPKEKKANILAEIAKLDDNLSINLQLFGKKEAKLPAKYKSIKLNDADVEYIFKEQEAISKMESGRAKTVRVAKLQSWIGNKLPTGNLQKISTIQAMAQLMNPKTAIRNTVGNAGFMALEEGSNVLATGVDALIGKITGQRTKAIGLDVLKAEGKGLVKGFKTGVSDAMQGIETAGFRSQTDLPTQTFKGTFKNTSELLKSGEYGKAIKESTSAILGTLEKGMNIELKATDRGFYQASFNRSIAEQMKVKGIKDLAKVTPEMIEVAHLDGLYRTFQDKNFLSKGFSGLKRLLNGGKEFGLGDLILKYPKTPANLIMRGIDYSPIGLVRSSIQLAKIITKTIGDKPVSAQLQKKFVEGVSRAGIGTGLFFLSGAMHKLGIIQGKSPKDSDAGNLLKEIGKGQYTFNTSAFNRWVSSGFNPESAKAQKGDTNISYDWMQPSALTISAGANRDEQLTDKSRKNINPLDMFGAVVVSLESGIDTMAEQPLVTGISNLFKGYGSISENFINLFQSAPASFVPTLLNQARQLTDNTKRVTNSDENYGLNKALNLVINKIPVLSKSLPEQVSTTGNVKEMYQNGSNKWYNVLFNPAFVSTYKPTEGIQTILDIYSETGETKQFPRKTNNVLTYNKKKLELTPEQANDLQKFVGQKTMERLEIVAKNPDFKRASTENQIKAIGKILDVAGKQGKAYMTKKLGSKYIRENLK